MIDLFDFLRDPEKYLSNPYSNEKNPALLSAVEELKKFVNPEDVELYLAREKQRMDFESQLASAREEGLKQGIQEGLELGIQEGLELGIQEGLEQGIQEGLELGIQEGLEQGIQEGLEKRRREKEEELGRELGLKKGLELGIEEGRLQCDTELITNALEKGMSKDMICDLFGYSSQEYDKILCHLHEGSTPL